MKNLNVFSLKFFFFVMTCLKKVKKGVYISIYFALTVANPKMVLKKLLSPPDLTKAQTLCIYEPIKIVVVGQDEDFILAAFQIVFIGLKSLNNH